MHSKNNVKLLKESTYIYAYIYEQMELDIYGNVTSVNNYEQ